MRRMGGVGGVINFLWCVSVFSTRGASTARAGFHFTVLTGGNVEAGGVEGGGGSGFRWEKIKEDVNSRLNLDWWTLLFNMLFCASSVENRNFSSSVSLPVSHTPAAPSHPDFLSRWALPVRPLRHRREEAAFFGEEGRGDGPRGVGANHPRTRLHYSNRTARWIKGLESALKTWPRAVRLIKNKKEEWGSCRFVCLLLL